MPVLLCAATEMEIGPTLSHLKREKGTELQLCITGIGAAATTYHLTKAILKNQPSLIIQAGIGGSLSQRFPLTEVVIVEKDCFADLGVVEKSGFTSVFDLELVKPNDPPFTNGWLVNPHAQLLEGTGLVRVSGGTVNEISTAADRINHLKENDAHVESMEGAALHFVALSEGIPFLQLRAISNFVGERDKTKWALQQSVKRLNEELVRIIRQHIFL